MAKYFDTVLIIISALIWLAITAYLRIKKKKDFAWLLFFTIFYIYFLKVLDYTLFQYQSLLIIKSINPNIILNGTTAGEEVNLIPLMTLTSRDIQTSVLNILLFIPFGSGLPFITNLRMKKILGTGALVSISIELLQLVSGYLGGITFRVTDINDVLFNTAGVAIGYALFRVFSLTYQMVIPNSETTTNSIFRYIHKMTRVTKQIP